MIAKPQSERFLPGLTAPALYLVARPQIDWNAVGKFETTDAGAWRRMPSVSDAEHIVELAGRVCYLSFGEHQSPKTNAAYIEHLLAQGHESVFEHAAWTFILTGVTRAFTHQLVRHRVGFAYSQLSQQYHAETDSKFVEPSAISSSPQQQAEWRRSILGSYDAYLALMADFRVSSSRESRRAWFSAARAVLPQAIETKIAVTANARALRNFLAQRGAIEGDEEMRVVASCILRALRPEAPTLFSDFALEELDDGSPVIRLVRNSDR